MSTPHLRRTTSRLTIMAVIAMTLLAASPIAATSVTAEPTPPQSNAYGRSLAEWMKLYWTWALGGDQDDHVGRVQFLPIPGVPPNPPSHLDVTLVPGTPFVLPVLVYVGETYADETGLPDDQPLPDAFFTDADILVTLDGKPVLDSSRDNLSKYYVRQVYFDEPIVYEEPTSYGSTSAIWVQGIGFVHHPLSVGTHTLTLHAESSGVVYDNTWTITVTPGSRN